MYNQVRYQDFCNTRKLTKTKIKLNKYKRPAMHLKLTGDSDTASTYQVSLVCLMTDK